MSNRDGCLTQILRSFGVSGKRIEEYPLPYRVKDNFLSSAEHSFYHVLHSVVGDQAVICPKVGLKDLLFISKQYRSREYYHYFGRIAQKHVDFVLCQPETMAPVVAIELDDSSHRREGRSKRDVFVDNVFDAAHLPLLRLAPRTSYNTTELATLIEPYLRGEAPTQHEGYPVPVDPESLPLCPKCGVPMVLRTATRGANVGQQFYGCRNYPNCREIVPIG